LVDKNAQNLIFLGKKKDRSSFSLGQKRKGHGGQPEPAVLNLRVS